jgi:hypothetical protein
MYHEKCSNQQKGRSKMSRNSLNESAQFSFAADLFMLQAILRSEEGNVGEKHCQLEYTFPRACFNQIIHWILNNPEQLGLKPFVGVRVERDFSDVKVTFPNEDEQDKLHTFFTMFNQKRKQAQGHDRSFPPMPDIYQGGSKPVVHVIKRYIALIKDAFEGDSEIVMIPSGPQGDEIEFRCN